MKKPRLWRAVVRPEAGRRLERHLQAENVGRLAGELRDGLHDPAFPLLLRRIDDAPILPGNRVDVFFRGENAFEAMGQAIDAAREEVLVESYILKDDSTGRAFLDAVGRAAARGVNVRVLADAWGSLTTRRSFWREMKRRGVEARLFNPLFPHLLFQPFRDHRKILVVDRRVAFTGGMNIADEYGSGVGSSTGPWRDTHCRVEGPTAWELAVVFSEAWRRAGGRLDFEPLSPPASARASILVLDSRPGRGYEETASALAAIVGGAREKVWITNAYFAPRARAVRILAEAVRRGVDVRLLLPGKSDVPLVRHAGHGYFRALLELGVRVYEYGAAILHAKTLVADDFVSVVGSTNLDFRSFHLNAEANLVILDAESGRAFADAFRDDLTRSVEIDGDGWTRRAGLHRIGDNLARRLGPLL
ncbi:MAG TPA: phospholipase D-like domain-containing protein [Thermoanaerobaculia bacterium]|jgi:cardiolipin synthase|nr:phospholipase D-like domain-containing protein [Thermoanaerobaculia bacterium]